MLEWLTYTHYMMTNNGCLLTWVDHNSILKWVTLIPRGDILENASPINYVNNIKGDLFVIHGRRDRQASYEQVLQLKRALESADIDFEYMIKGDEGHGFYSEANNLELYERMISFLETNLN